MTLDQFKYFLETSKFQHVGKAAKSLHISPSAVSTAISKLEEELESKLFERKGQGIQLTERGREFRDGVEQILDRISELKLTMIDRTEDLSGTYRLAASHFLSSRYLGRAWSRIQPKYGRLSVELSSLSTARVLTDVLSGSLDAGLCFSPLRHPDLKTISLCEGQLRIAVRKGHPLLAKPARQRQQSLASYPAIMHKAIPGVDFCENHPMFEKFGIVPEIKCLWDCDDLAMEVMKETDSWSLLPDVVCKFHYPSIQVLPAPTGWDAPYFIGLVLRAHRAESPFLRLLAQEVSKLIKN